MDFSEYREEAVSRGLKRSYSLDFGNLKRKIESEGHSICPECCTSISYAEYQYRLFLALQFAYDDTPLAPTKLIDYFWHAHILDTKSYQRDCQHVFGRFLHHNPYLGVNGAHDIEILNMTFAYTSKLWLRHFGCLPSAGHDSHHENSNCSKCSSCSSCRS